MCQKPQVTPPQTNNLHVQRSRRAAGCLLLQPRPSGEGGQVRQQRVSSGVWAGKAGAQSQGGRAMRTRGQASPVKPLHRAGQKPTGTGASQARSCVPLVLEPGSQPRLLVNPKGFKGLAPGPGPQRSDPTELEGGGGPCSPPQWSPCFEAENHCLSQGLSTCATRGCANSSAAWRTLPLQCGCTDAQGSWLPGKFRFISVRGPGVQGLHQAPGAGAALLPPLDSTQMVAL